MPVVIDATARFACRHEFVGLPIGDEPEYFRCHKCEHARPIEVTVPASPGVARFNRPTVAVRRTPSPATGSRRRPARSGGTRAIH